MSASSKRTILSVDGGGIRGIIPAVFLDHIEKQAGLPVSDLFDLMVGTSTGGIVALGLSLPDPAGASKALLSASDLANLYRERGGEIFQSSLWRRIRSLRGVLDETYSAQPLERALKDYFGSSVMADCRCPVMVTAYDIENRSTVFLKSFKSDYRSVSCVAAARATSAAPTYFEPARVTVADHQRALIDGGVYINSPAVSAYAEALKLFPGDDISVVSLGTGELIRPIEGSTAAGWGSAGWVIPLLDCMLDGVSKAADHQMNLFLGERYQRYQLSLEHANDDMDDASPENIASLFKAAEDMITSNRLQLDSLVRDLVDQRKSRNFSISAETGKTAL